MIISIRQVGLALYLTLAAVAPAAEFRAPHVVVKYERVSAPYAEAIAKTVEVARNACAERYYFDMPETIHVSIAVDPEGQVRLFNDGVDTFSLSLRSETDLEQPGASGHFQIYGFCHETAHLAMYQPIRDHGWLTTAGAEGWAHYLGSHLVDTLYKAEGKTLWPDPYDYRQDGSARLQKQFKASKPSPVTHGAKLWSEFVEIVGADKVAPIFDAWGKAEIDAEKPAAELRAVCEKVAGGDSDKLADWWRKAEPILLAKRTKSDVQATQITLKQVTGKPRELALDDGQPAGKKSIAGGAHAVRFEAPDGGSFLTSIRIHGSRYGARAAPKENFSLWLCDDKNNEIAEFKFPYSKFPYGSPDWVKLDVKPTQVPPKFIVAVGFNPSAKKGVFISRDAAGSGNSRSGLPGKPPNEFRDGDWLIRAAVDQRREADALSGE